VAGRDEQQLGVRERCGQLARARHRTHPVVHPCTTVTGHATPLSSGVRSSARWLRSIVTAASVGAVAA
jgi:hypothetical protein